MTIRQCRADTLPDHALLGRYAQAGAFTDCYSTVVPASVSQAEYVEAFYTSAVFKLERLVLAWFASRPSTDAQARQLAAGEVDSFAAWDVEARSADQLLLSDFKRSTRSWLMVAPAQGREAMTRLYFGSAVVPMVNKRTGEARMGLAFRALLGFHRIYSRVLLGAARSRLQRARR